MCQVVEACLLLPKHLALVLTLGSVELCGVCRTSRIGCIGWWIRGGI